MIVRINELDIARAEAAAEWGACPRRGPLSYVWPRWAHAYEVLVLDRDEQNRVLPATFRQNQVRHLIPETIAALREEEEEIVLRLDGALVPGELLHALSVVTAANWGGRFALSDAARYGSGAEPVMASLRVQTVMAALPTLCLDPDLALDRSVRLRAFGLPEQQVTSLLAIGAAEDERWKDVLPHVGFMVGTSRGLRSLFVITPRLDATTFKTRLTHRLLAAARNDTGVVAAAGQA
jgi:hypothetical protein